MSKRLTVEKTGAGQKVQNIFRGPFVIHRCVSSNMFLLRNPENGTICKSEVHLDSLKMAYIRKPEPTPYFLSKVVTAETVSTEKVTRATPGNVSTKIIRDQPNDGQLSALPHGNQTNDLAIRSHHERVNPQTDLEFTLITTVR